MLTVEQIPQSWKDVLSRVQGAFPGAIIAGGALRDLDHNLPPKDVDIFIPIDTRPDVSSLSNVYDIKEHILNAEKAKQVDRKIYGIYHINHLGTEFELIFGSPAACDIETFDINICQIDFNGSAIYRTQHYIDGVASNLIMFVNPQSQKRMEERAARITTKFPGYRILMSEQTGSDNGY